MLRGSFLLFLCLSLLCRISHSQPVVINEIVAVSSDHRLSRSDPSLPLRLGAGPSWKEPTFDDSRWPRGPGPFGFRHPGLGTDLENGMKLQTPSLYLRSSFALTREQIERAARIYLSIRYDDAFVIYLNGREWARRNLGLPGQFVYADQSSFIRQSTLTPEILALEPPVEWLRLGTNMLAIQAHNAWSPQDSNPNRFTFLLEADLRLGTPTASPAVAATDEWRYFIGVTEPSGSPIDPDLLSVDPGSAAFADWVELWNRGGEDLNLAGWSLTDDSDQVRQWVFPSVTLGAGEYLTVFCSGLDRRLPGQVLHANFKLDDEGEYLGLFDAFGQVVHELAGGYPAQSVFHSYGLSPDSSRYGYFATPTPGKANGGDQWEAICERPVFDVAAGFHDEPVTVSMRSLTLGGRIRYTLDGSEPGDEEGHDYAGPLLLTTNTTLRARVFRPGWIPSRIRTATYLIGQDAALRALPALALSADPRRAVYEPEGVTAIHGGRFNGDGVWEPLAPEDYNLATMYGRAFERPASFEWFQPDGDDYVQADCGLRLAGSPFSRPRMTMMDLADTVWNNGWQNKPSFSFFFRNDYGPESIDLDLNPGARVATFDSLRLRAGKNDWANPFVRDECVRRLFIEMGHLTSRGALCNFFVNGRFKGYFNLVERLRQPFFQSWTGSTNDWDVRLVDEVVEGDADRWLADMAFIRSAPMDDPANYEEAGRRFDLVNLVDYLILNAYGAMWDWPHNNWYAARERTADARWRFLVWDAEGSFGRSTTKDAAYETIAEDLTIAPPYPTLINRSIPVLFSALSDSPEFRLLFADRLQRHLFGDGALTPDNVLTKYAELRDALNPVVNYVRNENVVRLYLANWVEERPPHLLEDCRRAGLWPETRAPQIEPAGPVLSPQGAITLVNPNDGGELYYTLNGVDPRAAGGIAQGLSYAGPVVPGTPVILKTRVLWDGEWSPLAEIAFQFPAPEALTVTEIHYDPTGTSEYDGPDFEFVEIHNAGTSAADLTGVTFSEGLTFTFSNGPVLAPGGYAVVAANAAAFASRYPGQGVAGVFQGRLNNGGERLTVSSAGGEVLFSARYNDILPWPAAAAGRGYSLVPAGVPGANPDAAEYWRASALPGGSPGLADPEPEATPVSIREIHSRGNPGASSLVELFNAGTSTVDVSGWYLSLAADDPFQYQLPSNALVPPGARFVLHPSSLAPRNGLPPFSLSPIGGLVGIFAAGPSGELLNFSDFVEYDATLPDVTQGRFADSLGLTQFAHLSAPTLGAVNAPPRVGPVVINEILYDAELAGSRYIELRNSSDQPVPLFHANDSSLGWRLNGVGYDFSPGTVLLPDEIVLLGETDPESLRARHDVPPSVRIFGPWHGNLDRGGEWLRLEEPDWAVVGGVALLIHVPMDAVRFNDNSPWPTAARGEGASLQRLHPVAFGNDPNSWFASKRTPGRPNSPEGIPEPSLTLVRPEANALIAPGEAVTFQVDLRNAPGPVASVDYHLNGELVGQVTEFPYDLVFAPPRGIYAVQAAARFEPGLVLFSQAAEIQVLAHEWRDTVLVPWAAVWKYDDRGLDLGDDWASADHDDSTWGEGPAQLGYGEGDEATVVGYGMPSPNRNVTTYFRREFSLAAGLSRDRLTARLVRDDGAVLHINGGEAARSNMPEGAIHYRTLAAGASPEENVPVEVPLDPGVVWEGTNQLAVEIHQVHRSSPDLSFALELFTSEKLVEPWIVGQPGDAVVRAGEDATLAVEAVGRELSYQWYDAFHRPVPGATAPGLVLTGLPPSGGLYDYFATVSNGAGAAVSRTARIRVIEPDSDLDGMPDHWEDRHGFDAQNPNDASEDADGDGTTNVAEFERGTNPRALDLWLSIRFAAENGFPPSLHLEFLVPAETHVGLQRTSALADADWLTVQTYGPWSTNSNQSWESAVEGTGGFFRLSYENE